MSIQQIVDFNDYKQVFRAFKSNQYHTELNKVLLTKSVLVQYYYVKTLKEICIEINSNVFDKFVIATIPTNKQIFRNILTMYEDNTSDSLKHRHSISEGLPSLQKFYSIALEVFKD